MEGGYGGFSGRSPMTRRHLDISLAIPHVVTVGKKYSLYAYTTNRFRTVLIQKLVVAHLFKKFVFLLTQKPIYVLPSVMLWIISEWDKPSPQPNDLLI